MVDKPLIPTGIVQAMSPIEILDIGAMAEGEERFARLVKQGLANVSGFEPNPAEYERLRTATRRVDGIFPISSGKADPQCFI